MNTKNIEGTVTKGIEKLAMLRDEVKLHIHLASLDAKKEWDEKLEPKIVEVEGAAQKLSDSSRATVDDLVTRLEGFVAKLRGGNGASPNA